MQSFIQRFYRMVNQRLGDPHASIRYPDSDKLNDLYESDQEIFNSLLRVAGQESQMGYAEATITLTNGEAFYQLPVGFRDFLELQYRMNGKVQGILRSKDFYSQEYGVEVLSGTRGMRLFPAVNLSADQDWTLCYRRSPGLLHHAKATDVGDDFVVSGIPGTDAGEVQLVNDYYNGMELRVYAATSGAVPQQREIINFAIRGDGKGTFHLRHAFDPKPTGEVYYEVCPTLPLQYESIYALDVASAILMARNQFEKAGALKMERRKKWVSAKQFFLANVSDRGPTRSMPLKAEDFMPSGEVPYWYRRV